MSVARTSFIGDLESATQRGSKSERIDARCRITGLFLSARAWPNAEPVDVFDHLATRMKTSPVADLSKRHAPVENAPPPAQRVLQFWWVLGTAGKDSLAT